MNQIKKSILMVTGVLCTLHAIAQDTQHNSKTTLDLTGGYSTVAGNFAATDYSDNRSGFASGGYNLSLRGRYQCAQDWGILAIASYRAYGVHGLQNLAAGYKEDFAIDSSTIYSTGSNYTLSLLAGAYYNVALSETVLLNGYIAAGLLNAHMAGNKVDIEDNSSGSFEQKPATANAMGMQAGIMASYSLGKHYGIVADVSYYYSQPSFFITNENRQNNAGRLIKTYNQPITGLNTNIGIYYRL